MRKQFRKNQIGDISKELIRKVLKIDTETAKVVALSGELGAGKTTLTQEVALQLGIKENIVSPTFVIMKFYDIDKKFHSNFKKLIHIDAYRLDSYEELLKIGWDELVGDKNNLIIIEWPEKVAGCINDLDLKIKLSHINNETRSIEF